MLIVVVVVAAAAAAVVVVDDDDAAAAAAADIAAVGIAALKPFVVDASAGLAWLAAADYAAGGQEDLRLVYRVVFAGTLVRPFAVLP